MKNRRKIETQEERQNRHKAMESVAILDKLKNDFSKPLEAMDYFYDLFERVYCKRESLHERSVKVGTLCIQVPYEIIYALDAVPVRLCNGFHTDDEIGSDFAPSKACPLVKATVGQFSSGNFVDRPDLVVSPTTCDQKSKAGAIIESMGYPIYDMEFPRTKESEESREYWRRSVRKFAKDLSKELGVKLTRNKLKKTIQRIGYAQYLYHRLNTLRKSDNPPILGVDMFLVTNAFFFDRLESWIEAVERLVEECAAKTEEESATYQNSPRIVSSAPAISSTGRTWWSLPPPAIKNPRRARSSKAWDIRSTIWSFHARKRAKRVGSTGAEVSGNSPKISPKSWG